MSKKTKNAMIHALFNGSMKQSLKSLGSGFVLQKKKEILRKRILTRLRNQKEEQRKKRSRKVLKRLFALKEFKDSFAVLFYASFDGEVDTFEMIKQAMKLGKKIGLPRILKGKKQFIPMIVADLGRDLEKGPYGIRQPRKTCQRLDFKDIDLVVVPGNAFDSHNNRLGRGGGFYDRFLKKIPQRIPTVGLAFNFQILDKLPTQKHDSCVSRVVSN